MEQTGRDWHREIGLLAEDLAHEVNKMAMAEPSLTEDEKKRVNSKLESDTPGMPTYDIARIPDEIATTLLKAAGGCVHNMALLMANHHGHPPSMAGIARSAIENASTVLHLMYEEDGVIRSLVAASFLMKGYVESGLARKGGPFESDLAAYDAVVQRASREKIWKKKNWPNHTRLTKIHLSNGVSENIYDELSQHAHPNPVTAMITMLSEDLRPSENYIASFRMTARASMAITMAAISVAKFRKLDKQTLVNLMGDIDLLEGELDAELKLA